MFAPGLLSFLAGAPSSKWNESIGRPQWIKKPPRRYQRYQRHHRRWCKSSNHASAFKCNHGPIVWLLFSPIPPFPVAIASLRRPRCWAERRLIHRHDGQSIIWMRVGFVLHWVADSSTAVLNSLAGGREPVIGYAIFSPPSWVMAHAIDSLLQKFNRYQSYAINYGRIWASSSLSRSLPPNPLPNLPPAIPASCKSNVW